MDLQKSTGAAQPHTGAEEVPHWKTVQCGASEARWKRQQPAHGCCQENRPEELCQFDTIPPTATEASVRKQIAERNNVSESYVARSEKFMRGVEIMEQMMPGTKEKILSGQFKVRDADMHRLARADFPNRKQIVHEILHPEDRPAPQSSYSHYSGINYSALEVAVRRIQQDFDFLMRYLPKLPDDSYAKTETLKILKQHKAYMAQFEEMLNDEKIA